MTITAHNWRENPTHRRAFQNVQSLFPTTRVRRGTGPISVLPQAAHLASDLPDIAYESRWAGPRTVAQMIDSTNTDAFIVLKEGQIVYEYYANDMQSDSFHLLNSVTKSLTGTLACILIDQGLFYPDDLITQYVPELKSSAFAQTTVRHLLDMTAAVKYGEDYDDPNADFWIEASLVGWCPELKGATKATSLLSYAQSLTTTDQPDGEKFHYRSILTNLIGLVIERSTKQPLHTSMERYLWAPLGPEQDLAIVVDPLGQPYVGAGGNTCARDLARFGQMILQGGFYNNQQIVPEHWIDDIRIATPECRTQFADSDYGGMLPGGHYRNQFWTVDADDGILLALGIYGQSIHINMATGVVSVKFSTHPGPSDGELFQDTFSALRAISESV